MNVLEKVGNVSESVWNCYLQSWVKSDGSTQSRYDILRDLEGMFLPCQVAKNLQAKVGGAETVTSMMSFLEKT